MAGLVQANTVNHFNDYSPELQKELGRAFTHHLHSQYDVVQDPEINQYIRNLGHRIAQHTNNAKSFRFYVINNPDINAFAGPNGVIGIHTGLIQSVTTEDELASVIAHEIAHVTQDHLYRRLVLQSESTLPQIASMIAAILIGTHDTNAGMATLLSANALQIQQQLKYSRQHEYEADHTGISYLYESGYNPHAMPDFFEKLANTYQHYGLSAPEILRTHPLTENRLAKAQERAFSLAENRNRQDNTSLNLIQERLNQLYTPKASTVPTNNTAAVACYRYGLKQLNTYKTTPSINTCLTGLIKSTPQQFLYHAMNLELLTKINNEKNTDNPKDSQPFSIELFPNNQSILLRYAQLLESEHKTEEAIKFLEEASERLDYKYQTYTLLSRLYKQQDNTAHTYLNLALAQYEIGNIERAAIHIQKAKTSIDKKNTPIKSKILQLEEKFAKLLKKNTKE